MKIFCNAIVATALLSSPAALQDLWQQHQLNTRALRAGEALSSVYVRTSSEKLTIASAYAWQTKLCISFSDSGPAIFPGNSSQTEMAYAIFEKDQHAFRYNLDFQSFNEVCQDAHAGVDITDAVEKGAYR
jgi:hypothetical protein